MKPEHSEESYPLSPMQQAMLFQSLSAPDAGLYIQQMIWNFHEDVRVPLLKQAIRKVVARHPVLRTAFALKNQGSPCQTVFDRVDAPFEYHDLRPFTETERLSRIDAYLQSDRRNGFDMSIAPLMRFAVFQMPGAWFQVIWTYHHALMDGRSHFIVLKEIFEFYDALCEGWEIHPDTPGSYREYVEWLGRQDMDASENFWTDMLKGFYSATPLPVSRIPITKSMGTEGFGEENIRLSRELTSALQDFSLEHDLTVNALIQGAWAVLLARYSGEEDVVFGATRSCRHSGPENMTSRVGVFINTVPVRVRVSAEKTALSLLREMRAVWVGMREYEHASLARIIKWSGVRAGSPLFDSILVFENFHFNEALRQMGGAWTARSFELHEQTEFPLTVFGYLDSEIRLGISYNRTYFDGQAVFRMLGHLKTLLEGMTACPEKQLSELPMLTAPEAKTILEEWNATDRTYPEWLCMHEIFEAQAERTPDGIAVVFGETRLTYRELSRRSNQLARYLKKSGIGPDIAAGICMERSPDMIIALLGILKAGGAYVPIEPDYPKERMIFMLADTGAPVLLTQARLLPRLPDLDIAVVCLDQTRETIDKESAEPPEKTATIDNLAYIIYTSGSTGLPKGVAVEHKSLYNFAREQARLYGLTSKDRVVQFSSFSFDASVLDMMMVFCSGARLYMAAKESLLPGPALAGYLRENAITVITLPPSLLTHMPDETFPDLRILTVGGESCPHELFRKWSQGRRFFNVYGPTETTVFVTAAECVNGNLPPPVGRPIANTKIYILDRHMRPVPVGVTGELYIAGIGLARGYLNNPEQTAERFIANLFSEEPGSRLYKTGDRVRYLPDGTIEFIGRADSQVKIRGIRVEPGEIETILTAHEHIRQAAVIDRTDRAGRKRLVAYVAPDSHQSLSARDLHRFAREKLPAFLIPSAFVILETLPVLPSGKIDRRSLPEPDMTRDVVEEDYAAPRNSTEQKLAELWIQVLGIEKAGIYHSFFELGGDSLSAVQLFVKIEQVFGRTLSPSLLFQTNTIAGLVEVLTDQSAAASGFTSGFASGQTPGAFVTAIQPNGSKPPLFCVEPPDGQVIRYQALGLNMDKNYPVYGVHIPDESGFSFDTIEGIAASYVREILAVRPEGPFFLCGFCVGGLIAFEIGRQLHNQGRAVGFIALLDTYASRIPRYCETLPGGSNRSGKILWRLRKAAVWLFFTSMTIKRNSVVYKLNAWKGKIGLLFGIRNRKRTAGYQELPNTDNPSKKMRSAFNRYLPILFPGKIILFKARQQSYFVFFDEATYGWNRMAGGGVEVHMVDGGHPDIVHASQTRRIAEILKTYIDSFPLTRRQSGL